MSHLYRPTVHQLRVLDRLLLDWSTALREVEAVLDWLTPHLGKSDVAELRAQLDSARCESPSIDARYWAVQSRHFLATSDEPGLRVRFLAYQEGGALLLHTAWLWDGQAGVERFARTPCPPQRDSPSRGHLGVAYLWTAALAEGHPPADEDRLLQAILELAGGSTCRPRVRLPGLILVANLLDQLREASLQDVALFDSPRVAKSLAVGHLTLVEWPLWSLARLRLRHLYLAEHHRRLLPALQSTSEDVASALGRTVGQRDRIGQPILLVRPQLGKLQGALITLSGPQYQMLELLADAEKRLRAAYLELGNLERSIARAVGALLAQAGEAKPAELRTELDEVLTGYLRRDVAQTDADLLPFRHLAERATRSFEVLATQADILEAVYERRLNWVIGVVGIALAMLQIVNKAAAQVIYECLGMGRLWEALGGLPLGQKPDDLVLPFVHISIISILLLVSLLWLLSKLVLSPVLRISRWAARRVLALLRARH